MEEGYIIQDKLKYLGYGITFQEVPDEVSLVINISGCPYKCEGCHSDYLWEYEGNYLLDDLYRLLKEYEEYITCVCFMGGDQNSRELQRAIDMVHSKNLKVCIYSGRKFSSHGRDYLEMFAPEYYKIGNYDKNLGGLTSPRTNQRFYRRTTWGYEDITSVFRKGKHNDNQNKP